MNVYKRLGALVSTGAIGTADTLYECPTSAVVSTVSVCNSGNADHVFRICISTAATFQAAGNLADGTTVKANDAVYLSIGATMDDVNCFLLCSSDSTEVSFSAFGAESL